MQSQIRDLEKEQRDLKGQLARVGSSERDLQQELDRIRELSANTVQLDEQNKSLKQRQISDGQYIEELEAENSRLGSQSNREWFLVGAAVLLFGVILGLIIPRLRFRKKSDWGDF